MATHVERYRTLIPSQFMISDRIFVIILLPLSYVFLLFTLSSFRAITHAMLNPDSTAKELSSLVEKLKEKL
jgi:hypothetical protein